MDKNRGTVEGEGGAEKVDVVEVEVSRPGDVINV